MWKIILKNVLRALYLRPMIIWDNLEIIIVDDGSTDSSIAVIQRYINSDPRIQLVCTENGGLSHARNVGLDNLTGEYVTFLDSDDWITPNYIEVLYRNIQQYQADISVVNFQNVLDDKVVTRFKLPHFIKSYTQTEILDALYTQRIDNISLNFTISWGKLYRSHLFGSLRYPLGKKHEDEFTTYKLYMQSQNVVYEHIALYNYRIRQGSITNSAYSKARLDAVEALEERLYLFNKHNIPTLKTKYALCYLLAKNTVGLEKIGEHEKCTKLHQRFCQLYQEIMPQLLNKQKIKLWIMKHFAKYYFK